MIYAARYKLHQVRLLIVYNYGGSVNVLLQIAPNTRDGQKYRFNID